jgi:hypothetical protein
MDTNTGSSASFDLPSIEIRIKKAADVLKVDYDDFRKTVSDSLGIDLNDESLQLLNAQTTTEQIIIETLKGYSYPLLKLLAAAAILKGRDPFVKKEEVPQNTFTTSEGGNSVINNSTVVEESGIVHQFVELTKSLRDPKQMKDKELLELYDKERDYEVEQELHRRANFQHFVVLKPSLVDGYRSFFPYSTKKDIDIDMSLELLKRSRRMVNPTLVRQGDVFVNVYRVTELNPEDQIFEICSFCGEIMYDSYCEHCNSDFGGMGDAEKIFIKLITEMESFDKNSMSDRRAVLASTSKGLEDLRKTWPRVAKKYEELKVLGDLPKLKKSKSLPSSKPADPFHVAGNRNF